MIPKRLRRKPADPLEINLTLSFNYGNAPEDRVTVVDGKNIPLVGSVFASRDRIVRAFTKLLVKSGLSQPKVVDELLPVLRILKKRRVKKST